MGDKQIAFSSAFQTACVHNHLHINIVHNTLITEALKFLWLFEITILFLKFAVQNQTI